MYNQLSPFLSSSRLSRLWAYTLLLSLLRSDIILAQSITEADLWKQLLSQKAIISLGGSSWRWRGDTAVTLNNSTIITGPGSLIVDTPKSIITGSGGASSLTLRDITLFYRSSVLTSITAPAFPVSSGPFPAFNGSRLNLTFINVTVIAPFRTLTGISRFWSAGDLLTALSPQLPGGLGSGPQRLDAYSSLAGASTSTSITNMILLPSDDRLAALDCFSGGVPVHDSLSLRVAMTRPDVASIFVYQNMLLMPFDFNYSQPVHLGGDRSLEVYGCLGTTININHDWTRFGVQIGPGGALSLRGLTFTDVPHVNQIFWPRFMLPLLSLVYVGVGGGCSIVDSTIISSNGSDVVAYLDMYSTRTDIRGSKPVYTSPNSSFAVISSWNLTGADVWDSSPGVTAAQAAASFWRLRNVTVVTKPPDLCLSSSGSAGVNVDTGKGFRDLIKDDMIPAIRVVGNIQLVASDWPPEASGPAQGQIFVNVSKEVFACHPDPGGRYTIDFGNLGQAVFVFGNLHFRGNLLLTHPKPSARRSWLYLLIGLLSVEVNGIIQFDGVEIRGNTSSPFTNRSDPFWNYLESCGSFCSGFIPPNGSYVNISYYDAFIFNYRFNKTEWVAVSQNRSINGTGYWGYTNVALTWRPDKSGQQSTASADKTPVAAFAVPVAVGGSLLIAGVVVLAIWLKRRSAAAAAAGAARAGAYSKNSEQSYTAGGDRGPDRTGSTSHHGPPPGPNSKEASTLPQGSSTNVGPYSTTLSQGTSMLSGSAPAEARIEDMKRILTAHNLLTGTHRNEQITLTELLGEGTFGKVYRGTWRGTTVAVKTMVLPTNMSGKEKREKMAVMETAISSSLSHPNIVQTYTYAILPVKGDQMDNKLGAGTSLTVDSTSPLAAISSPDAQNVHSWEVRLVLEYCDRGSLRDVLNEAVVAALRAKGISQAEAAAAAGDGDGDGNGIGAAAMVDNAERSQPGAINKEDCPLGYAEVLDNCLDVARAMLHMHSESIVHGDLKARNILLKSGGVGDGRTYVSKVADFGLSLRIDPHETHVSNVYQGTITHMAPEVLLHGKVSKMSDVYAFAILMWEAYTGGQAFKGTPRALLGHEVTKMNRRPQFPLDTPFEFQLLACRCWESDPSIRPTFEQIIGDLTRMRAKLSGDPGSRPPASIGPPLSGSLATGTVPTSGAVGGVQAAPLAHGGDSLMTASTASLPVMPMGGNQLGHFGGGAVGGIQQSVTLNSDSGNSAFPGIMHGVQGLLYLQGVDGSTMASQSGDGLSVTPGTFTIGARPPFAAAAAAGSGGGGGGGVTPSVRAPPSMPPILETYTAQPAPQE